MSPRGPRCSWGRQFERLRISKTGPAADELELSTKQFLLAIFSESFDQPIFAGHYLSKVEADVLGPDAPRLGMARQVHDLGRVEQRLGWHAAAQYAQAADFLSALN